MRPRPLVLVPALLVVASFAWAQFRRGGDSLEAHLARPDSFDGRFHYCRAVYRPNPRGDGGSWLTDYPLADIDLSVRVSELTKIAVSFDGDGQPRHLIVRLTDDELFQEGARPAGPQEPALRQRDLCPSERRRVFDYVWLRLCRSGASR